MKVDTRYLDRGSILIFVQGGKPLMFMSSIDSFAKQNGKNEVIWKATLSLDSQDTAVGKPVNFLKDADLLQMGFLLLQPSSHIKSGKVIITLNSAVSLIFDIPEQSTVNIPGQDTVKSFFVVPNISPILAQEIK